MSLDDELSGVTEKELQRKMELEQMDQEQRRQQAEGEDEESLPEGSAEIGPSRMQAIKDQAREKAKQEIKSQIKKRVEQAAVRQGATAAASASAPVWGTALGVIAIILGIIVLLLVIFAYMISVCNESSWKGTAARGASWLSSKFGLSEDICAALGIEQIFKRPDQQSGSVANVISADAAVWAILQPAGVTRNAFPPQTNLGGMRESTVNEILWLKNNCGSGCDVRVTGGTEPGHAAGDCSHANGYKFDVGFNSILDNYIRSYMNSAGLRNGDPRFVNPVSGAVYVRESNHWDVSVACYTLDE